ncbi:hypothetical protein O1M54_31020 [Streptomyces diastatochromogenes]|nr:hypothetical protein [Streptomyces diastatochromogenes]
MNRTIAAAAAEAWNSGWSRSASCSTKRAKTDMKADKAGPSVLGYVVVPG